MAIVVLVGAVACGQPAVLDGERTEARIAETVTETYGVEVDSVACPDEIEVRDGARFRCRARLGAGTVPIEVRQTDGEGALDVMPTRAVLVTSRVEADIAEVLADRFERDEVEVACGGDPVRIEAEGATFECVAVDGAEQKGVAVRVRDTRGALTYTLT